MAEEAPKNEKDFNEDLYQEAKPGSMKLDKKTKAAVEEHLKKTVKGIIWDHKSIKDPDERELAIKTKDVAERTFAVLYADNPTNAKEKWHKFASRAPTKEMIDRVENMVIEKDYKKAIPNLFASSKDMDQKVEGVKSKLENKNRDEQLISLKASIEDTKQRSRDFGRKGVAGIFEKEQEVDGFTLVKSFMKGFTRVGDDFLSASREKKKVKEMQKSMKDIYSGAQKAAHKTLAQKVNAKFADQVVYGKNAGLATGKLVGGMMIKAMAGIIKKMSGANQEEAAKGAPKQVQLLLAPPALRITHDRGMGPDGPEMGRSPA